MQKLDSIDFNFDRMDFVINLKSIAMKKVLAGAMMIFGTMFLTAQVTTQDTARTKSEKKMKKMNQKSSETVKASDAKSVDSAEKAKIKNEATSDLMKQQRDGINDEATKPMQPAPGQTE